MNLAVVYADDTLMRPLIGLSSHSFKLLVRRFEHDYMASRQHITLAGKPRRRAPMNGHKGPLATPQAKVFFVLFYAKHHPSQGIMAVLFDSSQGQVSRWLKILLPLVEAAHGAALPMSARKDEALPSLIRRVPEVRRLLANSQIPNRAYEVQ